VITEIPVWLDLDDGPAVRSYAARPSIPLSSPAPKAPAEPVRATSPASSSLSELVRLVQLVDAGPAIAPPFVNLGPVSGPVPSRSDGSIAIAPIDTVRPMLIPERKPEPPAPVQTLFAPGQVRGSMPALSCPDTRVVSAAASASLSPGDMTAQEAAERMGGQNTGAMLALVGVAAAVLFAFVF
jgi:hypothetical protein